MKVYIGTPRPGVEVVSLFAEAAGECDRQNDHLRWNPTRRLGQQAIDLVHGNRRMHCESVSLNPEKKVTVRARGHYWQPVIVDQRFLIIELVELNPFVLYPEIELRVEGVRHEHQLLGSVGDLSSEFTKLLAAFRRRLFNSAEEMVTAAE